MAKTKGALFSLGASGKLAGTLVYSKWKAEPYAREYVTPSNPRTSAQMAQRGKMRQAIEYWHLGALVAAIREAWGRAAGRIGKSMSGVNLASRSWIDLVTEVAATNLTISGVALWAGETIDSMAIQSAATVTGDLGLALSATYDSGTSKLTVSVAADNAGTITTSGSIVATQDLSSKRYAKLVATTTDGTKTIDLTGIIDLQAL